MYKRRRIFNYDDLTQTKIVTSLGAKHELYENSISAGGCLFYKKVNNSKELLLISYSHYNVNKLDDLGGKSEIEDKTVFDMIIRETLEESNFIININFLQDKIFNKDYRAFYNANSKYYILLIEVDESFYPDTSIFGNFEETDKIFRDIKWYEYDTVKSKLSARLLYCKDLINYLNHI